MGKNGHLYFDNIHTVRLENMLKEKCKFDVNLKWPALFEMFIIDGLESWREVIKMVNIWWKFSILSTN